MALCRMFTDRNDAGLRGPVHTCATEHDVAYPDHHWISYINETFSERGHLLERRHSNADGSHWSIVCRHDQGARLFEKEHRSAESQELYCYEYDELGRLERVIERSPKHGERVFESFRYYPDGTKIQTTYPARIEAKEGAAVAVASEALLHVSLDAVAIMTVFDAMDRPMRKVLYDVYDRVIHRVQFRHDVRGLLVEEGELVGGRIRDDFRNLYRYDLSGRQIESEKRWGFGGELRTFSYNELGDVVEERIEQTSDLSLIHHDQSWTRQSRYEYDERQNWTVRTIEEGATSTVERRTITYY